MATSLRHEIAEKDAQVLSLARWKLLVVAAVCVAGLGWADITPDAPTGILILYSVGFLCAYLDLLIYRRLLMIHVLSSYLRRYDGDDRDMLEEKAYELSVERARSGGLPFSERWGHFFSSVIFSLGPAVLAHLRYHHDMDWLLVLPGVALLLNGVLFAFLERGRRKMREATP